MAPHLPGPELVARFRADLAELGPVRLPLGIAYSGGPDSLALLLLAGAAFPREVRAATVDHGLRPGSAEEAAHAADVCCTLGIPHATLTVTLGAGASVQAGAREARYRALAAWMDARGIATLLTAHHLDDQAETLLMRLLRGSGVAGLAGIRARRPLGGGAPAGAELRRPLLGWPRAVLAQIASASGFGAAADPSNEDEAFDRVRIRRLLGEARWLDRAALARSAAALADAEDALEVTAARCLAETAEQRGDHLLLRAGGLPAELRRRVLLGALRRYAPDALPRGEQLTRAIAALDEGRAVTLAGVKLSTAGHAWRIERAPPRRLVRARHAP